MEEARRLDGQDRFLNWKAARYLMRAGDIEGANSLLGLFTKVSRTFYSLHLLSILLCLASERCTQPWIGPNRYAMPNVYD